jgi:hypothetical protein
MTLREAIAERQGRRSRLRNRVIQQRAEKRMDEIVSVAEIATDYEATDRAGDLEIESRFSELYQLVDSEEEKAAVARAFAVHQRAERREDLAVRGSVDESVDLLRTNNDFWLGSFVPDGDGGAA